MNKKTIWWIVGVVAVVVIVIIAVLMMGGGAASQNGAAPSASDAGQPAGGSSGSAMMSLQDLLAAGTSQQCAFSSNASGTQTNGTVFVATGHMRGDFTASTARGQTVSHMITDGTTAWVWTDSPAQGYTMSFASMSSMSGSADMQSHATVNPSQKADYTCTSWPVDQSKFTPPADITFQDMSAMMGAGAAAGASAGAGSGSSANMCAACNSISNASQKASCLAALHC